MSPQSPQNISINSAPHYSRACKGIIYKIAKTESLGLVQKVLQEFAQRISPGRLFQTAGAGSWRPICKLKQVPRDGEEIWCSRAESTSKVGQNLKNRMATSRNVWVMPHKQWHKHFMQNRHLLTYFSCGTINQNFSEFFNFSARVTAFP